MQLHCRGFALLLIEEILHFRSLWTLADPPQLMGLGDSADHCSFTRIADLHEPLDQIFPFRSPSQVREGMDDVLDSDLPACVRFANNLVPEPFRVAVQNQIFGLLGVPEGECQPLMLRTLVLFVAGQGQVTVREVV